MRHGPIRWLYRELPGLVEHGVLAPDAATALQEHYGPLRELNTRRILLIVFGLLGALLIGCGVVLILAHSWDGLPRPLRAGLCFALLLAAQGLALGAARWRPGSEIWTEGSAGFLSVAVITCISLIAQTYQMGVDLQSLLLVWLVLTLPIAYLLSSRLAMAICWLGATQWIVEVPWRTFSFTDYAIYLGFVILAAPFLVRLFLTDRREPRNALLGWVVCGCLALAGAPLGGWPDIGLRAPLYAGMLGSSYALGIWLAKEGDEPLAAWRRPFHAAGALGLGVLLFTCSFQEIWSTGSDWVNTSRVIAGPALAIGIVVALTAGSCIAGVRLLRKAHVGQGLLACTPLLIFAGWAASLDPRNAFAIMLVVNLYAVAVGLTICVRKASRNELGAANLGLLLALAVLTARFLDANISFVVRGVGFIMLGAAFLAMNLWMLRRRGEARS